MGKCHVPQKRVRKTLESGKVLIRRIWTITLKSQVFYDYFEIVKKKYPGLNIIKDRREADIIHIEVIVGDITLKSTIFSKANLILATIPNFHLLQENIL